MTTHAFTTMQGTPDAALTDGRGSHGVDVRGVLLRTPYWVVTAGLAIVFLFPLVWAAVASVAPQPGSQQVHGWGLGNYNTLVHYQDGIAHYLLNSLLVSSMTVVLTLVISLFGGYGATEAGVVVLATPCVLLFLALQRHYVRGFMSGALKG